MCVISMLQMAKWLECKATAAISPTAPTSSKTVLGAFASSKTVLFEFNITLDIWPWLSALFVSHCVEMKFHKEMHCVKP